MRREITIAGAAVALGALAGLTATANAAEPSVTVSLTHNNGGPAVEIDREVTWTLAVAIEGFDALSPAPVIEAINLSLQASDPDFGWASDFTYSLAENGGTQGGLADGLGFSYLSFTNSLFLEFAGSDAADHSNPLTIGTFTTTATTAASLTYTLGVGTSTGSPVTVGLDAFNNTGFALADIAFTSDSLVVPAPASAAILASAGLLAGMGGRRRR